MAALEPLPGHSFGGMVQPMVIFCGRHFLRRLKISDVGIWQDWFKRLSASWQERVEIGASLQARVEIDAGLKEEERVIGPAKEE